MAEVGGIQQRAGTAVADDGDGQTFVGPKEIEEFADRCAAELLKTARHRFLFPPGCTADAWRIDEIKKLNENLLGSLRRAGNVYALFTRDPRSMSGWIVQYVGERKAVSLRERITSHLIYKNQETGSKLSEIQRAVSQGHEVGLSFILVRPESLRLFVEETIIAKNRARLPWNSHG